VLVAGGVATAFARSTAEALHAGFTASLDGVVPSAQQWRPYAVDMPTYLAADDANNDAEQTAIIFEQNADVLERGTAALRSMAVIDIGDGVLLSATGEANVADMALGGQGYTGHNLHALTRGLSGWSSIRAEEGFVIIVRWQATKWQVGATGKHIQTSNGYDYALDKDPVSSFVTALAWRDPSGRLVLAQP
jgi:hypothetical protein